MPIAKNMLECIFKISYPTQFGESLHLIIKQKSETKIYPLHYVENNLWQTCIEFNKIDLAHPDFSYGYCLEKKSGAKKYEGGSWRTFNLINSKNKKWIIHDQWNDAANPFNLFNSPFFLKTVNSKEKKPGPLKIKEETNHIFSIQMLAISKNFKVAITGNNSKTGLWSVLDSCIMTSKGSNDYSLQLTFTKDDFPFEYKYVLYDTEKKQIHQYEFGSNRLLSAMEEDASFLIHDGFPRFHFEEKKGAGVSIPVFSLRSRNSGGVGEFNDLQFMGDWCEKIGIQLIQVLPINDTTVDHSWHDSYPYSAISAFALHPMYLNIQQIAGKKYHSISEKYLDQLKPLNQLAEVNYPEVNRIKWDFFREIFPLQHKPLFALKSYQDFFEQNKFWLEPYAAFCFLKTKYKTADFSHWPAFQKYHPAHIKRLLKTNETEISLYYFIQFHLYQQLIKAVNYLKKKNIFLKADLPIGIKRESVDFWQYPELFIDHLRAGAPPDAFAEDGQNWGFPVYQWEAIQKSHYAWWIAKFINYGMYATAIRLDHVLGFFRIWSIPKENVQGTLGYFKPSNALSEKDFHEHQISFNEHRFCQPLITKELLSNLFAKDIDEISAFYFTEIGFNLFAFKEKFQTQRKLWDYLMKHKVNKENPHLFKNLLYLHTEKILLKEEGYGYHFRVNMQQTFSFATLDETTKNRLNELYHLYFFNRQNDLWLQNGDEILSSLHKASDMLYCGEDLGWVPDFVPGVLRENGILSLEVQRMPKNNHEVFTDISAIPYLSIATPDTHDMPVLRHWWEMDEEKTQLFYNSILKLPGKAPQKINETIIRKIVEQFLLSPAMWSIFPWQDMMAIDDKFVFEDARKERINDPANADNKWNYRMHIFLEELCTYEEFNKQWNEFISRTNRNKFIP